MVSIELEYYDHIINVCNVKRWSQTPIFICIYWKGIRYFKSCVVIRALWEYLRNAWDNWYVGTVCCKSFNARISVELCQRPLLSFISSDLDLTAVWKFPGRCWTPVHSHGESAYRPIAPPQWNTESHPHESIMR